MKKKVKFLIGISIILVSLFINFVFSEKPNFSKIIFDNIDALAEGESGNKPKPTCILSVGTDESFRALLRSIG